MPGTPESFSAALKKFPFDAVMEPLMKRIVLTIQKNAMQRTPVLTGTLRRSLTSRVEDAGAVGRVGTNVIYAPFVHRRVPFLQQALEASEGDIERLMQKAGDDYLAQVAKETG